MTVKKLAALLASAIISLSAASCDKSPSGPDEPTFTQRIAFYGASSAIPVPVVVTVDGTQVGTADQRHRHALLDVAEDMDAGHRGRRGIADSSCYPLLGR